MSPKRNFRARFAAIAMAASWVATVVAQTPADPADPEAKVPAAAYRSPFEGYRALGDEAVGDWRAANEEVGRIGGWREYAREAQAPDAGNAMPVTAPTRPATGRGAPGAHGGHTMPGGKQ